MTVGSGNLLCHVQIYDGGNLANNGLKPTLRVIATFELQVFGSRSPVLGLIAITRRAP